MSNATEETIRKSLNATAIAFGSVATSGTAGYMSVAATTYTGGIVLTNASSTATEVIWIRRAAVAVADDDTSYPIAAGQSVPIAWGDLSTLSVISASGTPRLGWIGTTL